MIHTFFAALTIVLGTFTFVQGGDENTNPLENRRSLSPLDSWERMENDISIRFSKKGTSLYFSGQTCFFIRVEGEKEQYSVQINYRTLLTDGKAKVFQKLKDAKQAGINYVELLLQQKDLKLGAKA
jgi:hypothetical protein